MPERSSAWQPADENARAPEPGPTVHRDGEVARGVDGGEEGGGDVRQRGRAVWEREAPVGDDAGSKGRRCRAR